LPAARLADLQERILVAEDTNKGFLSSARYRLDLRAYVESLESKTGQRAVVHMHNAVWFACREYLEPRIAEKVPVVSTFHGILPIDDPEMTRIRWRSPLHGYWVRQSMKKGRVYAAVSRRTRNQVAAAYRISEPSAIRIVYNGVARDESAPGWPNRRVASRVTLGFIGSIERRKNWRLAVELADCCNKRGLGVRLVVAGDGPEQEQATEAARRRPYMDYLGPVSDPIRGFYPQVDILLLPSLSEGLPVVALEAISRGIPILSSAAGGLPEIVRTGVTGFCCEQTGLDDFERGLRSILDQGLESLRGSCERVYRDEFTADSMSRGYEALYREALSGQD